MCGVYSARQRWLVSRALGRPGCIHREARGGWPAPNVTDGGSPGQRRGGGGASQSRFWAANAPRNDTSLSIWETESALKSATRRPPIELPTQRRDERQAMGTILETVPGARSGTEPRTRLETVPGARSGTVPRTRLETVRGNEHTRLSLWSH